MSDPKNRRSKELEELRLLLFPQLSPEEGWRKIEAALERAGDSERSERIEQLANDPDLDHELLRRLRELREGG